MEYLGTPGRSPLLIPTCRAVRSRINDVGEVLPHARQCDSSIDARSYHAGFRGVRARCLLQSSAPEGRPKDMFTHVHHMVNDVEFSATYGALRACIHSSPQHPVSVSAGHQLDSRNLIRPLLQELFQRGIEADTSYQQFSSDHTRLIRRPDGVQIQPQQGSWSRFRRRSLQRQAARPSLGSGRATAIQLRTLDTASEPSPLFIRRSPGFPPFSLRLGRYSRFREPATGFAVLALCPPSLRECALALRLRWSRRHRAIR